MSGGQERQEVAGVWESKRYECGGMRGVGSNGGWKSAGDFRVWMDQTEDACMEGGFKAHAFV